MHMIRSSLVCLVLSSVFIHPFTHVSLLSLYFFFRIAFYYFCLTYLHPPIHSRFTLVFVFVLSNRLYIIVVSPIFIHLFTHVSLLSYMSCLPVSCVSASLSLLCLSLPAYLEAVLLGADDGLDGEGELLGIPDIGHGVTHQ